VTRYARTERSALADALHAAGPDAPTLCEGWTTRDLAAHVVLRERDPVAAAGIVVSPLSGWMESRRRSIARRDFDELIRQLRRPPVWSTISNPIMDEISNLQEMYIHHEDVRRAQPRWRPRALDPGLEEALWRRVRRIVPLALRRFRGAVVFEWPGHGRASGGAGGPEMSVRGKPSELTMFLSGRQAVADVTLTGPDDLVDKLTKARLGI
jgi:uncharacterized protein (TIGR03085 family)